METEAPEILKEKAVISAGTKDLAAATAATENLVGTAACQGRCIRLPAVNVDKVAKYRLSQPAIVRFFAETALKTKIAKAPGLLLRILAAAVLVVTPAELQVVMPVALFLKRNLIR